MAKWKPGECPNPSGRPKGSKNKKKLPDRLKKAASEKVVLNEGGRKRKVDKIDVALTQLMNKAAQGESSYIKMMLTELKKAEATEPTVEPEGKLTEADQDVIAQVIQRILQQASQHP
jgi:Family of unknown function (DUF5681)